MKNLFYISILTLVFSSCGLLNKGGTDSKDEFSEETKELKFQEKFFEAEKEKALDNMDKAYAAYLVCVEVDPEVAVVYYELARIDLSKQDARKAIEQLEKAIKLEPENRWYLVKMGEAQTAASNYEEATKYYNDVIALSPKDYKIYELKAQNFKMAQNIDGAIKTYDDLEKITSITEETSLAKYDLYIQSGKKSQGETELLKLIEAYPNEIRYNGILAEHYAGTGETEKALVQYEKMKAKDPDNGLLHWQLSQHYEVIGEQEKSFEELKLAFKSEDVEMEHKLTMLREYSKRAQSNSADVDKAIELSELIDNKEILDPEILNLQGRLHMMNGDLTKAGISFRKAVDQGDSKLSYWMDLLLINYLSEDATSLKENSEEALELFPVQPEIYLYSGLANLKIGESNKSILNLRTGNEFVIENPALNANFYVLLYQNYLLENNQSKSTEYQNKMMESAAMATYKEVGDEDLIDIFGKTMISKDYFLTALNWYDVHGANDQKNPIYVERVGDVFKALGLDKKANEFWLKAQDLGGDTDELKEKLN